MRTFDAAVHYWGKPCRNGHDGMRYINTARCVSCCEAAQERCKEISMLRQKEWREENQERLREYRKANYEKNRDERLEYNREYQQKNREAIRDRHREYHAERPGLNRAYSNAYHTRKLQRTPKWADLKKIEEIYRNCPPGMHVDHVIPLQGELVSGLHVHNNLQYLTQAENTAKLNKFDPETFDHQQPELFS